MKHSPGDAGGFGPRTILQPPVSYQGGKRRLAPAILDAIRPDPSEPFWDLCCGGGAVALEAVRRGHRPELLTMVDAGPWGEVWRDIGAGTFDLVLMRRLLADVPSTLHGPRVREHMLWLSRQPVTPEARPATYLVLQAGSWGGRAVGWSPDGKGWTHEGFRGAAYPCHPHPTALYERLARLCEALVGMAGVHADVRAVPPAAGVAYLDPPYVDTKRYAAGSLNAIEYARDLPIACWVSERRPLSPGAVALIDRRPGGIVGGHTASRSEWLSLFARAAPPRTSLPLTSGVSAASPTERKNR